MLKKGNSRLIFWSGIIGNILDHYDSALYVFLAPFLAPVFFPDSDPVNSLIAIYLLKSTNMITRPLGAITFGYLVTKYNINRMLALSLTAVAICTFFIGIIPGYEQIGIWAPIFLTIIRSLQGFFASGENAIVAMFILEHAPDKKKPGKANSYYLASTMLGTPFASFTATLVSMSSEPSFYWRIAFIFGVITALVGIWLRVITNMPTSLTAPSPIKNTFGKCMTMSIKSNKLKLFKIIILNSFNFLTYALPFIFFNNFIPLITNIQTSALLVHNTILAIIDVIMIPVFGIVADRFNFAKWMCVMAFLLTITIIPIFYLLPHLTIIQITFIKLWIIMLGVAFITPLNAYLFNTIRDGDRYVLVGFGYAVGSELLGRNISVICLLLWKYFSKSLLAPALYVASLSLLTGLLLLKDSKTSKK